MCIAAVAVNQHPEFPIIIIDNREEILTRETVDPAIQTKFNIACGLDSLYAEQCGTWLGVNVHNGDFAVLTNVLESHFIRKDHLSRGVLVSNVIQNIKASDNFLKPEQALRFSGYNLIFGNLLEGKLRYTTNRKLQSPPSFADIVPSIDITDGVHCVSNSYLNDETWPKVKFLRESLKKLTEKLPAHITAEQLRDELAMLLCSRPQFPIEQLPGYILSELKLMDKLIEGSVTKVPERYQDLDKNELKILKIDLLEAQRNIFVHSDTEKTRSQTIILVHKSGLIHYFYRNTDKVVPPVTNVPILPPNVYPEQDESVMKEFAVNGWKELQIALKTQTAL
jgi:uncharacterized protein with NRDE domain